MRSRLLFFAEFLEPRIVSQRIEHWIEPEQRSFCPGDEVGVERAWERLTGDECWGKHNGRALVARACLWLGFA